MQIQSLREPLAGTSNQMPKYWIKFHTNYTNFLGVNFLTVAETIVGLLLCCGVMIIQCPSISCITSFGVDRTCRNTMKQTFFLLCLMKNLQSKFHLT